MKLSIVIPAYNEEKRLPKNLKKVFAFCDLHFKKNYEVIVIDDGSTDKTRKICEKFKVKLNQVRENKGKGYSVREGVSMSKGQYIYMADSDFSTPIEELLLFFEEDSDIVIGSRALKQSQVKTRQHKKFFGNVSSKIISLFLNLPYKDTQCGFKLFKAPRAKQIFLKQKIDRWGFDFEILYIANKFSFSVKEIPVKWVEDQNSKVSMKDYPRTFIDLVRVRYNSLRGKYD